MESWSWNNEIVNTIPGDPESQHATTANDEFTGSQVTGKPAINYISDDDRLLYVLYASCSLGYRAGACNSRAFLNPAELYNVDPEELDSYEVGIMHELFDNRMRVAARRKLC